MWALDNQTPFKAERSWSMDLDGRDRWVVVVKGTFQIKADGTPEPRARDHSARSTSDRRRRERSRWRMQR